MPRGRQYYDPIIQVPSSLERGADLERIELFPVVESTRPEYEGNIGKWMGRRIAADGSVAELAPGDFDHDRALAQAQQLWPGLEVFELRSEQEDSTWSGTGPSPRLWQGSPPETSGASLPAHNPSPGGSSSDTQSSEAGGEQLPQQRISEITAQAMAEDPAATLEHVLRLLFVAIPGRYVLLDDVLSLLENWAVQFENEKNPSGALALREAIDALKDVG